MSNPKAGVVPALRVIVEGLVIVVSILLAFGIDAWWDGLQERKRVEEYALGLLEDANTNLERLAVATDQAEGWLGAAAELGERLSRPVPAAETDTILRLLVASAAVAQYTPVTQGFDQVVAAGDLGLLSREVRVAMAEWTESLTLIENSEAQVQEDRHISFAPFLVEETSLRRAFALFAPSYPLGSSRFPPAVEELAASRRLDNLLTYRIVYGQDQLLLYARAREALVDVISILQKN